MLTLERSPFLCTGVIRASFQCLGSTEHSKDLLYRKDKGLLSSCAHSFKQNSGQPSGPGALLGFSWVSLSNTIAGVIVMSVSEEWQPSNWYWGIDVQSSLVNTLVKNLLKSSHFS